MLGTVMTDSPEELCAKTGETSRHPDKSPSSVNFLINMVKPHNCDIAGQAVPENSQRCKNSATDAPANSSEYQIDPFGSPYDYEAAESNAILLLSTIPYKIQKLQIRHDPSLQNS
jgi:hypothetical protein